MGFSLNHVVFYGRTWEECMGMYSLEESDLTGLKVLDCPGGPDALVADGLERGLDIHAIDPQYVNDPDVLDAQGHKDIIETMEQLQKDPEEAWNQKQADDFQRLKLEALERFVVSYRAHRERFRAGSLPDLALEDDSFDLVLSGNFLFAYSSLEDGGLMTSGDFDLDFHVRSVRELVRVGLEVRLFPTFALTGAARRHAFVEPVMAVLRSDGHEVELIPCNWTEGHFTEFNDVIRIRKRT